MKDTHILIIDKDDFFVEALNLYLMNWESRNKRGLNVTGYSSFKAIKELQGNFDLCLVSEDFIGAVEENSKCFIKKLLVLSDDISKKEDKDTFYKYQSMENLVAQVYETGFSLGVKAHDRVFSASLVGVYSPMMHELSEPFALCVCSYLSGDKKTLFVDLSEVSVIPGFMGDGFERDLIDLFYELENEGKADIGSYIKCVEGLYILTPVGNPSMLAQVTEQQWENLFDRLCSLSFDSIVIMFGGLIQGMSNLLEQTQSLLVLGKEGEYYSMKEKGFMDYIYKIGLEKKCHRIYLPMTAANLKKGFHSIGGLISGNMLDFVRKELLRIGL